jgi:hypothetical protein
MLDVIRTLIRKDIAAEVPDDLSACMDCDSIDCPEKEFKNCPNRLARLTELQRLKNAKSASG